jgi:hypothetical protein
MTKPNVFLSGAKRILRPIERRFKLRHRFNVLATRAASPIREMEAFRGIGRGRRCFVMGNGPSLKKIDPTPLRQEITFGTNAIYLARDWLGFLPTYHVTEDTLVIEDRGAEISAMTGPIKFYDKRWSNFIPPNGAVVHPRIVYDYSDYAGFPLFSQDAAKCLWTGGTVSYLCLQLAYYMEFDPVILIGFDHSYQKPAHVSADGHVWTSQGDDPNHIDPNYFGKGYRWHDPRVDRMETAYRRARSEFEQAGRKVFNSTVGGHLEVFERKSYDTFVGGSW